MSCKPRLNKFGSLLGVTVGGVATFAGICAHRGDEKFYSKILMPFMSKFVDPELAHNICIFFTKHKLIRCQNSLSEERELSLRTPVLNMMFTNPVGLAAGFDKNCHAAPGLIYYGLGFAEIGTVTPKPQPGNPKKRIFRIPEGRALINRCGFNNVGIEQVKKNLHEMESCKPMILGLNIGKNKDTDDMFSDFILGIENTKDLDMIDYLVVNVSSPNTPGLRATQEKANLEILIDRILTTKSKMKIDKPLFLKIAPDITEQQRRDIAKLITNKTVAGLRVDGLIISNTTITRPLDVISPGSPSEKIFLTERGGLSGPPLAEMSNRVISDFYKLTNGQVPIIGVGGISNGNDAYEKIKAGASLVQIYTSLTYDGPPVVNRIKRELAELLARDGFVTLSEAIGVNHRNQRTQTMTA
ncbi:Dihydroorotate dehydrogenase (quinone), mitochondrial, partial [Fragariocoptes setiger]